VLLLPRLQLRLGTRVLRASEPVLAVAEVLCRAPAAGTTLRYKPGVITGGAGLLHDCPTTRGISYFMEPLIIMCLFGKKVCVGGGGLHSPSVACPSTTAPASTACHLLGLNPGGRVRNALPAAPAAPPHVV
jgi:hypothetical protein